MNLTAYVAKTAQYSSFFEKYHYPWCITQHAQTIIRAMIAELDQSQFTIINEVAIHKDAVVETPVTFKGPIIIQKKCFIASGAYVRGGVFLGEGVTIGPSCEIKSSFIFDHSSLAHFNYVGDSLVGSWVNSEAGAIFANFYNEKPVHERTIQVVIDGALVNTGVEKFGALVGDHTKIGANAVISPGTILVPESVVGRLQLVDQVIIK